MVLLTEASTNLFTRPPEEHIPSFEAISGSHCSSQSRVHPRLAEGGSQEEGRDDDLAITM